ncbi:MAG: hypothetical protein AB7P04_15680 [Bacteriovoracia bacterium]
MLQVLFAMGLLALLALNTTSVIFQGQIGGVQNRTIGEVNSLHNLLNQITTHAEACRQLFGSIDLSGLVGRDAPVEIPVALELPGVISLRAGTELPGSLIRLQSVGIREAVRVSPFRPVYQVRLRVGLGLRDLTERLRLNRPDISIPVQLIADERGIVRDCGGIPTDADPPRYSVIRCAKTFTRQFVSEWFDRNTYRNSRPGQRIAGWNYMNFAKFLPSECDGGQLPDESYEGQVQSSVVCGASGVMAVLNAGDLPFRPEVLFGGIEPAYLRGPGVVWYYSSWSSGACERDMGYGDQGVIAVTYVRRQGPGRVMGVPLAQVGELIH